jgi:superfamily II DNA/RNA helicase
MFDMGFTKDVSILLGAINPVRQSLFFSATLNGREEALVKTNSKPNLVKVTVKMRDTATSVDQDVVKVAPDKQKIDVLHDILVSVGVTKTLVFARTKWGCEKLAVELKKRGFRADSIHGNKTQYQRQRVLAGFKQDRLTVLVATDVAARGLDIPDVSHVINYEIPDNYEDYIHRIGRTGRANKGGKALTFIGA